MKLVFRALNLQDVLTYGTVLMLCWDAVFSKYLLSNRRLLKELLTYQTFCSFIWDSENQLRFNNTARAMSWDFNHSTGHGTLAVPKCQLAVTSHAPQALLCVGERKRWAHVAKVAAVKCRRGDVHCSTSDHGQNPRILVFRRETP